MTAAVVVALLTGVAMVARAWVADRQALRARVTLFPRATSETYELVARSYRAAGLALVGLGLAVWAVR